MNQDPVSILLSSKGDIERETHMWVIVYENNSLHFVIISHKMLWNNQKWCSNEVKADWLATSIDLLIIYKNMFINFALKKVPN